MKKLILLVIMAVLMLTGCTPDEEPYTAVSLMSTVNDAVVAEIPEAVYNNAVKEYYSYYLPRGVGREERDATSNLFNIYGNKECVCEIEGLSPESNCHVELLSPFVNASVAPAAPLVLSDAQAEALKQRRVRMQIQRQFDADTLYDFLPVRGDGLFDEEACVRYVLDDYTRFHTLEEDFIEFISELRARKGPDGKTRIQVRLDEDAAGPGFAEEAALVLLDGVPVFDHAQMMAYDPLLIESVSIYPQTCYVGSRIFKGVVNFITYKRNLPGFTFGGGTRVVDWQGVSWPQALTGTRLAADDNYPDYRQTLYWHPLLEVGAGESVTIPCSLPDYRGSFVVVAEGLDAAGRPVHCRISFTN